MGRWRLLRFSRMAKERQSFRLFPGGLCELVIVGGGDRAVAEMFLRGVALVRVVLGCLCGLCSFCSYLWVL
jgi:hypothetical protein